MITVWLLVILTLSGEQIGGTFETQEECQAVREQVKQAEHLKALSDCTRMVLMNKPI